MLKNYFKVAIRNLKKRKSFAIINILSLAIGITGGIFMLIYALDEFSFDNFHEKSDRIYRVNTLFIDNKSGLETHYSDNGWPVGNVLEAEFPEVEKVVYTISWPRLDVKVNQEYHSPRMLYTNKEFFEVFSFETARGDVNATLEKPYFAVITKDFEARLFQGKNGIGKEFFLADSIPVTVGAVVGDVPLNSHIQFDLLLSQATFDDLVDANDYTENGWGNINMGNYLLLREGVDQEAFKSKAKSVYMDKVGDMMRSWGSEALLYFEPMEDIYLKSQSDNSFGPLGSIDRVYLVMGVCLFTILLACINFVNLSTARSVDRYKEVGLRKVIGSSRSALISQFLMESFVLTVLGCLLALVFAQLMLPVFNELLNKSYTFAILNQVTVILGMVVLVALISIMAGYYPALHLSALQPIKILKSRFSPNSGGLNMRKMLVVFQFFISVSMALGTVLVLNQLEYMQQKELGFNKEELLVINASKIAKNRIESLKNEMLGIPGINQVTYSNGVPGRPGWIGQIAYPEGRESENPVSVEFLAVDENYMDALGLELVAGRFFDPARETDMVDGLVLNEKAVEIFGWASSEEALGQRVVSPSTTPQGTVIGVVRDYHQRGLQQNIHGIAMAVGPQYSYWLTVKFEPLLTKQVLENLQAKWQDNFLGQDFKYFYLNEDFERLYLNEIRLSNMFKLFAGLTFLISIIGLVGLVSFMIESRAKEISIRKVMGAGTVEIVSQLSKEFLILVCLAAFIAVPVVWYFGKDWLQNFAYSGPMGLGYFLAVIILALLVTLTVVGFQAIRAAFRNTVKGLRSE